MFGLWSSWFGFALGGAAGKPEEMFGFGAPSAWAAAESSGSYLDATSGSEQMFGIIRCLPGKTQYLVLQIC
jgi:hypothetical protein